MAGQEKSSLVLVIIVSMICAAAGGEAAIQPDQNCPTRCGKVDIEFPFGTSENCYLHPSFLITCHNNSAYLQVGPPENNLPVLNISPEKGEMVVSAKVAKTCYDASEKMVFTTPPMVYNLTSRKLFSVSQSRNRLTVIGCNSFGVLDGFDSEGRAFRTDCISYCTRSGAVKNVTATTNDLCRGAGCCRIHLSATGLSYFAYDSDQLFFNNNASTLIYKSQHKNQCSYAFLVQDGDYNFSPRDLDNFRNESFPVLLDWAVANQTCQQAKVNTSTYKCKAHNSRCENATTGLGYICRCQDGFEGNPYLYHGCQGIILSYFFYRDFV
ncbi:hypothetical protein PIB30_085134 [Stylosanthes scabra]|uniref:Wall-associated receptor kinase galacturonan-binding domain-containing protein n=1 Tax=Stylosanthes scabra TaxID=79078 RepID=A0ABU6VTS4_9FABA|nr:hypothetical protein [Stylosanthes scabra]